MHRFMMCYRVSTSSTTVATKRSASVLDAEQNDDDDATQELVDLKSTIKVFVSPLLFRSPLDLPNHNTVPSFFYSVFVFEVRKVEEPQPRELGGPHQHPLAPALELRRAMARPS